MLTYFLARGTVEESIGPRREQRESGEVTIFERDARGIPKDLLQNSFLDRWAWPIIVMLLVLLLVGAVVLVIRFWGSTRDFFYLVGFAVFSIGGGVLGGYLAAEMPYARVSIEEEGNRIAPEPIRQAKAQLRNQTNERKLTELYARSFRRWLLIGLLIAILGSLIATYFLAQATDLTLPWAVTEAAGRDGVILLLSNSNGYWHGITCGNELVSIPTDKAGRVLVYPDAGLQVLCPD